MNSLKQKIILLVLVVGAVLIYIFQYGLYIKPQPLTQTPTNKAQPTQESQNEEPRVVSTNPQNLDGSTLLPTQVIEITFNLPLENAGEFKNRLDPKGAYQVKLSDDWKTAKIIPSPAFSVGVGYTLFILPGTKFQGKKTLEKEFIYHFNTISYKGI